MQSLRCRSCHSNVVFVACNHSNVAEIAVMLKRSQQCLRDCSDVTFVARNLCNNCDIAEIACNKETQKMCHVVLPKGRQSGVSHVQQGGFNLTDNNPEFASTISLFCRCCCPVVLSNASSYCLSRCPPSYRCTRPSQHPIVLSTRD